MEAQPSENIFIGDLPEGTSENTVWACFSGYGDIQRCKVMSSHRGRIGALVQYRTVDEAAWVVDRVNGNIPQGLETPVVVRFAQKPKSKGKGKDSAPAVRGSPYALADKAVGHHGGSGLGNVDNLFINGLPEGLTDEDLRSIFDGYGVVVQCKVLPYARNGGCAAMVRYETPSMAQWVIENLNGNIPEGLVDPVHVAPARTKSEAHLALPSRSAWGPRGVSLSQAGSGWDGGAVGKGDASWGGSHATGWTPVAPSSAPPMETFAGSALSRQHPVFAPSKGVESMKGKGKGNTSHMKVLLQTLIDSGALPGGARGNCEDGVVFVGNLPKDTTDADLFGLFCPFGAISPRGVRVMIGDDGICKGYGFVNYLDMDAAQTAINTLNGAQLPDGQTLKVSHKGPPKTKQERGTYIIA